jgi:hypothetical protein
MASPTGATMVRLKFAPQRGHAVALTEIMAPHAGQDVILVMALPHASPFVRSLSRAADQRSIPVSLRLKENIEDLAFGVDCAPEIDHPATDFQINLVQMPD